jgi:hypothetical protein
MHSPPGNRGRWPEAWYEVYANWSIGLAVYVPASEASRLGRCPEWGCHRRPIWRHRPLHPSNLTANDFEEGLSVDDLALLKGLCINPFKRQA